MAKKTENPKLAELRDLLLGALSDKEAAVVAEPMKDGKRQYPSLTRTSPVTIDGKPMEIGGAPVTAEKVLAAMGEIITGKTYGWEMPEEVRGQDKAEDRKAWLAENRWPIVGAAETYLKEHGVYTSRPRSPFTGRPFEVYSRTAPTRTGAPRGKSITGDDILGALTE